MKKPQIICAGVVLIVGFIFILHAQEAAPVSGGSDSLTGAGDEDVSGLSDLEVELKAVEMTEPEPATAAPLFGNFYSAQHAPGSQNQWPPLPANIKGAPFWALGGNFYLLSDLTVNYNQPVKSTATTKTVGGMEAMDVPGIPGDGGRTTAAVTRTMFISRPSRRMACGWAFPMFPAVWRI